MYGESTKSDLVAIIVPDKEAVKSWAQKKGITGDYESLCKLDVLKMDIGLEMNRLAEEQKLNRWEYPKNI